jgi:DNA-binding GntR family transcriptional regulator
LLDTEKRMNTVQKFILPSVIGEELAHSLSDAIIFLKYEPGSRVVEEDLCIKYGLSRSPVREALRILEAEGLAVRSARRGARIAPISQTNLTEVYACREALEGLAAFEAARHADPAILEEMQRSIEGMKSTKDTGDIETFFAQNVSFTCAIHRASRNETLQKLLNGIEKQSLRYRYLAHLHTHEMLEMSYDGQLLMYEAISEKRPRLARRRAVRLIRDAYQIISKVVIDVCATQNSRGETVRWPQRAAVATVKKRLSPGTTILSPTIG